MQCEHIQRELAAYQSGSLPPETCAAIEAHLSTCEACTEEATAMKEMGDLLARGLKQWVDHGTCPPGLAEEIERNLRSARERPWYQRWPAMLGVVASVAAVFLVVLATQPELAQRMAAVPLIGVLATQLSAPEFEFHADPQRPVTAALFRPTRTVDLQAEAQVDGVSLAVQRVSGDGKLLRVQYLLRDVSLKGLDQSALKPALTGATGPLQLHSYSVDQKGSDLVIIAYFDAVQPGQSLTLTAPALTGKTTGPWVVTFTN